MRKFILIFIFLFSITAISQDLYKVKLRDKGPQQDDLLSKPEAFLSSNAVLRKKSLDISVSFSDLPVYASYKNQIIDILKNYPNTDYVGKSKWFNTIYIRSDNNMWVNELNHLVFVEKVERYPLKMKVHFAVNTPVQYGGSQMQSQQVSGDYLHNKGFLGQGMYIAVFDGGFHNTHSLVHFQNMYSSGRFKGSYSFVNGDTNVYFPGSHGTNVLSVLAATSENELVGSAPLADYWLMGTENEVSETKQEEINWLMGAEMADSLGVDIITASLGYSTFDNPADDYMISQLDGNTALVTQAALMAARKGILVVNSAGNEGNSSWQKIIFPADADSILAVAAVNFEGNRASFSSVGPSADQRVKPDVAARGVTVATSSTAGLIGPANGTSFSAPIISGFAACLWQSNPNFSAQEIREAIIKSAHQYQNPDSLLGYGIVNFQTAFDQYVGIQNFVNEKSFALYPNPTQGFLNLKSINLNKDVKYQIYNTLGNVVMSGTTQMHGDTILDISSLPVGMYYFGLQLEQGEQIQRIIKY